jgi:hypothetical protein
MTTESAALLAHIQAENRKTLEWVSADPHRFATTHVEDLEHWNTCEVFTVEDFIKYNLACEIYDGNKEIYGYRLDFLDLMQSTVEELTAEVNSLRIECRRQAEQEEADRVYEKAEEEYSNWMNSAHEDRAIRDRYEDLAEAAEY